MHNPKPLWLLELEKSPEALRLGRKLEAKQAEHNRKVAELTSDHDWSDCIGVWNRGEDRRKQL